MAFGRFFVSNQSDIEIWDSFVGVSIVRRGPGVGMVKSIFNFVSLIIGGGMLCWPKLFKLCGWLGAIVCLCTICLFAETTMTLMVNCAIAYDTLSYEETCRAAFGPCGYYIVALACYLMEFGVLVTYWTALEELTCPLLSELGNHSQVVIKLSFAAIMLPFCYVRNLGQLPAWSYISCFLNMCVAVIIVALSFENRPQGDIETKAVNSEIWPSLGIIAFTFCNHDSVFTIYQNLKDASSERWGIVTKVCLWSTVGLMLCTGLPIYLNLGTTVQVDITDNLGSSPTTQVLRAVMSVNLGMAWVYMQQVSRKYLHSLVMPCLRRRALGPDEVYEMSYGELVAFTTVQFGVTLLLAVYVPDLGWPMALTGLFAQSITAFLIPPVLLWTTLRRGRDVGYNNIQLLWFFIVFLFGVLSCTLGSIKLMTTTPECHGHPIADGSGSCKCLEPQSTG
mmetsp:Transcript_20988/g.45389  ORF Transcript_20988/g.45389 Transcript_20988/m.45389 type:complete len:449 (-) Transcript_20988:525-1871(-)